MTSEASMFVVSSSVTTPPTTTRFDKALNHRRGTPVPPFPLRKGQRQLPLRQRQQLLLVIVLLQIISFTNATSIDPTTTIVSSNTPVNDQRMMTMTTKKTTTATTTTIAFGSCHKSKKSTIPSVWESILSVGDGQDEHNNDEHGLDAFVWTGDAIYPSHLDPITKKKRYGPATPEDLLQDFEEMKINTTIGYTRLLAKNIPVFGTWDDHDYGANDGGKDIPNRFERQEVFWNFLGYRPLSDTDSERTTTDPDGVYHSVEIFPGGTGSRSDDTIDDDSEDNHLDDSVENENDDGRQNNKIKLILLDTRTFRDAHCIPSVASYIPMGNVLGCLGRWLTAGLDLWKYAGWWGKKGCEDGSMLGEEQWTWLETQLLTSTADLNIIVSSVQIWTTNPAMESWGHFPKEHERLWTLLQRHYAGKSGGADPTVQSRGKVGPVIFWSGDVHHGEISGQPGYLEITSSGLTHHCGQATLYGRTCRPLLETFPRHRYKRDSFFVGLNYGVLKVDWTKRIVLVEVKDSKGHTKLSVKQLLDMGRGDDDVQLVLPNYDGIPHTWDGHLWPWLKRCFILLLVVFISKRYLLLGRSSRS